MRFADRPRVPHGFGIAALTIGVALIPFFPARGDAIPASIGYSTSGWVSAPWASGPISFVGLSGATLDSDSPFPLGQFAVAITQPGVTTTYTDTPFAIDFTAPQFHRVVSGTENGHPTLTQYDGVFEVYGHLDGTVGPDGRSNVVATFGGVSPSQSYLVMTADRGYLNGLPFPVSDLRIPTTLALDTPAFGSGASRRGTFPVTAQIAAPEPGSFAIFILAILGSCWSARRRASSR
jgi:hypothetical protein